MTLPTRHISVAINRPVDAVYEFASSPANLPQWASGLSGSIEYVNGEWVAESPMGTVKVKFADRNPFGVLDHSVTLPSGAAFYNPMRVLPNDNGCEVVFTLFRRPEMSVEEFEADAALIAKDLESLKRLLEQ
jgi:hypothetical protein